MWEWRSQTPLCIMAWRVPYGVAHSEERFFWLSEVVKEVLTCLAES